MRTGDREAALELNRMLLDRREPERVDPLMERAWFAQLELFRVTGRLAAGRAFIEKIGLWCRESNREDLLDRVGEWTPRFQVPSEAPLLFRLGASGRRLEIELSGVASAGLNGRPRQRALLALTFAYPSGLSLEDAVHMLDVMWRRSSPKWPGPGGKLSLSPLPTNMNDLSQSQRMALVKEQKVREAVEKLVADTIESCVAAVREPLLRLVDSRIERDDPRALVRAEIGAGAAWRAAQPSDVASALRDLGIVPLVEFAKLLGERPPAGPGRPRTINSSLKRERLAVDPDDAPPDGIDGFLSDADARDGDD